jgi:hypothetical protein
VRRGAFPAAQGAIGRYAARRLRTMKHEDVESSVIHSVAYDELTRTMEVRFQDGDRYRYFDVEPELIDEFLDAESKGQFFNDYIRDSYLFNRVW